jgi:hypothetical protein
MILGIVGAEEAKFTELGKLRAIDKINSHIKNFNATGITSGHCHLGGIDIWAEEVAKSWNIFNPDLIFAPKELNWESGYKPRNILIAKTCEILINITVDILPLEFKGMRHSYCYHCAKNNVVGKLAATTHVKSGGCWTMYYAARNFDRPIIHDIVKNY